MSLVFAAIAPHPPLLVPNIGKNHIKKIQATADAVKQLERDLYVAKPDTILIISPHGHIFPDVFTINAHPELHVDLKDFGDLVTKADFSTDLSLIAQITEAAKMQRFPFVLQDEAALDYGASIPLLLLTQHLPKIKIVAAGYSGLDYKLHLDFGYLLKEEIMKLPSRVAVIASSDLSHCLSDRGPGGFSVAAPKFDETILEGLKNKNSTALLSLDQKLCEEVAACGLRSILILLGVLRHINYDYKLLSYEKTLGVGYMVSEFQLK